MISTPCLDLLQKHGFGATIETPISLKIIKFVGYAYVDNTNQVKTEKHKGEDIGQIVAQMQKAVDCWETGIRATGGAIRPEKCHWYLMDYKWENSQWKLSTIEETKFNLMVLNSKGNRELIKRKEYDNPEITLGVYCTPNGLMHNQSQQMYAAARDWADKIMAGHMDQASTYTALTTTI